MGNWKRARGTTTKVVQHRLRGFLRIFGEYFFCSHLLHSKDKSAFVQCVTTTRNQVVLLKREPVVIAFPGTNFRSTTLECELTNCFSDNLISTAQRFLFLFSIISFLLLACHCHHKSTITWQCSNCSFLRFPLFPLSPLSPPAAASFSALRYYTVNNYIRSFCVNEWVSACRRLEYLWWLNDCCCWWWWWSITHTHISWLARMMISLRVSECYS